MDRTDRTKTVVVEGIHFNPVAIYNMNKKKFVDSHKSVYFLDREMEKRESILSDVYDKIKGVSL